MAPRTLGWSESAWTEKDRLRSRDVLAEAVEDDVVGEVVAQVHTEGGVADLIRRAGADDPSATLLEPVTIGGRVARPRILGGCPDRGPGVPLEVVLDPAHDVVGVGRLPDAVDHRAAVRTTVAGVEHHVDPRQIGGVDQLEKTVELAPFGFPGEPALVPRRQVAGQQQIDGDLDGVADGDRGDVVDPRPLGDLHGGLVHLRGQKLTGEAHHHRRVQRLAVAETVDGVLTATVAAELQRPGAGAG
jgi:hypothetical protein